MSAIKNIIFDLGAVVLNIDYDGPAKMLESLGVKNFNAYYSKATQTKLFDNLERGIINPEQFRSEFNKITDLNFSDALLDKVWNSIILDFPLKRLELIVNLKSHYKTFLLSNTNKIHYDFYTAQLNNLGYAWEKLFHASFFSHEMGLRKPDKEIFFKALNLASLNPNETLFIDDLPANVKAAEACGMHTIWLNENTDLVNLFEMDANLGRLVPKFQ